jgi:hypothetical protein
MTRLTGAVTCATGMLAGLLAWNACAADATRADVEAWLQATPAELPAPGSVIGPEALESVRALLAPAYFDHFNHQSVTLQIEATANYEPHPVYVAATEANAGKATLAASGGVENHTAGRPFDPERFDDVSPEEAGMMVAWNHVYRWQYYGYKVDGLEMAYLMPGPEGARTGVDGFEGGGKVDRSLTQVYHRVYLNHLAMLPDSGFRAEAAGSENRYFKDYISFVEPFDVAGTTFVVERALDANEEDQVNSYLPSQRRVRRLSAKERADNFMGSNFTLDDFEGFSGRVMDYEWIYRGQKQVLAVTDSQEEHLRFGGPLSDVPLDRWQVRPSFVVELKPRWSGHPMSAKFLLIDQETYTPTLALVLDRDERLWRVLMPVYKRQQADASTPERSMETSPGIWRGSVAVDFKAGTATIARCKTSTEFPTMTKRDIERTFALSRLTEGR